MHRNPGSAAAAIATPQSAEAPVAASPAARLARDAARLKEAQRAVIAAAHQLGRLTPDHPHLLVESLRTARAVSDLSEAVAAVALSAADHPTVTQNR